MKDDSEDWREVPQLRSLRRLVSALTMVLILGMIAVAAALIWRISSEPTRGAAVSVESVTLPTGEAITASGAGPEALSFITRDGAGVERMRLFDPETGAPTGVVEIRRD
ncbi:MAG: DUF6476 family protein [Pseudomonadota bacterium]